MDIEKINITLSKAGSRRMSMSRTVPAVVYTPVVMGKDNTFQALPDVVVPYGWSEREKEAYCKANSCFVGRSRPVNLSMSISAEAWLEHAAIVDVVEVDDNEG